MSTKENLGDKLYDLIDDDNIEDTDAELNDEVDNDNNNDGDNDDDEDEDEDEDDIEDEDDDYQTEETELKSEASKLIKVTSNVMTVFELGMIICVRTRDILSGRKIYVEYDDGMQADEIAMKELREAKCPLSIVRKVSREVSGCIMEVDEVWDCNDMILPD